MRSLTNTIAICRFVVVEPTPFWPLLGSNQTSSLCWTIIDCNFATTFP